MNAISQPLAGSILDAGGVPTITEQQQEFLRTQQEAEAKLRAEAMERWHAYLTGASNESLILEVLNGLISTHPKANSPMFARLAHELGTRSGGLAAMAGDPPAVPSATVEVAK